jgi:hypothetical protein
MMQLCHSDMYFWNNTKSFKYVCQMAGVEQNSPSESVLLLVVPKQINSATHYYCCCCCCCCCCFCRYYYYYAHYCSTTLYFAFATFSVSWSYTQLVGLLGRGISPSQGRYLHAGQHKQNKRTQYRHPYFEWDSNPRSQHPSDRRQFIPLTAQPLWSACDSLDGV